MNESAPTDLAPAGPMRGRRIIATIATFGLCLGVWAFVEWRSAPPPPPVVKSPAVRPAA